MRGRELGREMWMNRKSRTMYEVRLVQHHDAKVNKFLEVMIQNMICWESEGRLAIQKVAEKLLKIQKHLRKSQVLAVMSSSEKSLSVMEYCEASR